MQFWKKLTIKNKLMFYSGAVFFFIALIVSFDIWIVKYFMIDFNHILEENVISGEMIAAMEDEKAAFKRYMRTSTSENLKHLKECEKRTQDAIYATPLDYASLGELRYGQLQAIRSSYEVYCKARDQVVYQERKGLAYIKRLYEIYDMQDYLHQYIQDFFATTGEEGNAKYQRLIPSVSMMPTMAIIVSILILLALMELTRLMNHSITDPVLKMANASKKIAANDFFVEDIETENEDELGELVQVFNKMKFATGEYIMALEEKREALDQLHIQEMEKLETEKRLDSMKLEMLKNQIQPHFLFNTLNVIAGMAELEDAATTEKMITALSSLFRYNLKTQQTEVFLSQELKVAKDYMYLQQMRFGDRVQFEIDCQVDANAIFVPTFIMQPLLENAMIHGITPKEEGGKVQIFVFRKADMLHIQVSDDGVGMSRDKLEHLRKSLSEGDMHSTGIGMANIYKRMHSMYDAPEFIIQSSACEGTRIELIIPYQIAPVEVS